MEGPPGWHPGFRGGPQGGPQPGYAGAYGGKSEPPRRAMLRQQLLDLHLEDLSPALAGPRLLGELKQASGGGAGGRPPAFGAAVRPLQRTYLYEPLTCEAGGALPALAGDGATSLDACMRAYRDSGPGTSWQPSKVGKFVLEGAAEAAERPPREPHEHVRSARASVR